MLEFHAAATDHTILVAGQGLTPAEFVHRAADHLDGRSSTEDDPALRQAVQKFLDAGLSALVPSHTPQWVEYRLHQPDGINPRLYAALAALARELLTGAAEDFFFMHKSPGLRVRFRLPDRPERPDALSAVESHLTHWQHEGLIHGWSHAVYEPEAHIFGGPTSMESVHRIFTADSLAWADFWSTDALRRPVWALSLLMIEGLFDSLRIVGWEDRDVWDRLRRQGQRSFPGEKPDGWPDLRKKIQHLWSEPGRLHTTVESWGSPYAGAFRSAVQQEAPVWFDRYFTTAEAYVGPREAAAFLIVYHWNRARLPFTWQCAITEALAGDTTSKDR
ncbi:thiopeptide-type bacteriocin biosynthesis protein [Streptomyces mirabilis]|uniref:thiopeptide-type bacteriocin biosynthesis protein n=1 Tax=Streptomyces mirabilis TaxID=68239 RepID=UPI0037F12836